MSTDTSTTATCIDCSESTPINSSPTDIAALSSMGHASTSFSLNNSPPKSKRWLSKTCEVCSAIFDATQKHPDKKTCSPKCAHAMLAAARHAKLTPLEKRPSSVERKCKACARMFFIPRAWLKHPGGGNYCSRKCSQPASIAGMRAHPPAHKKGEWRSPEGLESYRRKMSGPNNPAWKGGITLRGKRGNHKGVVCIRCPKDLLSMARPDGYIAEHRVVVARALGRLLTSSETVHHLDHDSHNNAETNLALFKNNADHKRFERYGSPLPIWSGCPEQAIAA